MTNTRRIATIPTDALVDEKLRAGLKQNTGANNYFNWIYELCQPFLGEKILEIGAGIGDMTSCFQKIALVHATELSESSRRDLSDRFQNNPNVLVKSIDIFSPDGETYSSVVLINVQNTYKMMKKL
jgi:16S rRNA A1518/A1519 N6-dimethyltransferase RsmA/KsgA/DIM1 with predicted DNA glycosylase/AP lyase activity